MSVLVGKQAPDFTAVAVMGDNSFDENFTLSTQIQGKYAVVFFYPLDFTFVCPSELIAFDHRLGEFKARNVEVIGVSIDSTSPIWPGRTLRSTTAASARCNTPWWPTSSTASARLMMWSTRTASPSVVPS